MEQNIWVKRRCKDQELSKFVIYPIEAIENRNDFFLLKLMINQYKKNLNLWKKHLRNNQPKISSDVHIYVLPVAWPESRWEYGGGGGGGSENSPLPWNVLLSKYSFWKYQMNCRHCLDTIGVICQCVFF